MYPTIPRRQRGVDPVADWLDETPEAPREKTVAEELEGTVFTDPVRDFLLTGPQPQSIHERPGSVRNIEQGVRHVFEAPDFVRRGAKWAGEKLAGVSRTPYGRAVTAGLRTMSPALDSLMSDETDVAQAQVEGFLQGAS